MKILFLCLLVCSVFGCMDSFPITDALEKASLELVEVGHFKPTITNNSTEWLNLLPNSITVSDDENKELVHIKITYNVIQNNYLSYTDDVWILNSPTDSDQTVTIIGTLSSGEDEKEIEFTVLIERIDGLVLPTPGTVYSDESLVALNREIIFTISSTLSEIDFSYSLNGDPYEKGHSFYPDTLGELTVSFFASKVGYADSETVTRRFTIAEVLTTPTLSTTGGIPLLNQNRVPSGAEIFFTNIEANATFFYTLDGSKPSDSSSTGASFLTSIVSPGSLTIKVFSRKDNFVDSSVVIRSIVVLDPGVPTSIAFSGGETEFYFEEGVVVNQALQTVVEPSEAANSVTYAVTGGLSYDGTTITGTPATSGVYEVIATSTMDPAIKAMSTVYIWEDVPLASMTGGGVVGSGTFSEASGLAVGGNWTLTHSAIVSSASDFHFIVKTVSGYTDPDGDSLPSSVGLFVDKVANANATVTGSLTQTKILSKGKYSLSAVCAGDAPYSSANEIKIFVGSAEAEIREGTTNWTDSKKYETSFFDVDGSSSIQYGLSLSIQPNSLFWGFITEFKLKYIPTL